MDRTVSNALKRDWEMLSDEEKRVVGIEKFSEQWVNDLVDKGLPEFKDKFSQAASRGALRRKEIADSILQKWKSSHNALSILVEYCAEVGEQAFTESTLDSLQYVLRRCHAKALMVTREIMLLLTNGYPDAAMARWRTLHETNVISAFVKKYGEECATRYIHHEQIDRLKSLRAHRKCADELNWQPVTDEVFEEQEKVQKELVELYGSNFKQPYGWAEKFLKNPSPKFDSLAEHVGFGHWSTLVKTSSYSVHCSYTGLLGSSISPDLNEETWLVGQSDKGLFNPAQLTAISFFQITIRTILNEESVDKLPDLVALKRLLDETIECLKIELE